jgi:hypothetical protein
VNRTARNSTLVLVNMSAQAIEKRLFLHRFRDAFVVRYSRPELLGTSRRGMIAFDPPAIAGRSGALFSSAASRRRT